MKIPERHPVDMRMLDEGQLDMELEKGYADMLAGKTKPTDNVFAGIRKDFDL